ncbi:hypothetical protein CLU79DRAFT_701871, partial [Phycomyces nitens]
WKLFWRMNIHHSTRNIWFRFCNGKFSCNQRLNQIFSAVFRSQLCHVCQLSTDAAGEFLYLCPYMRVVWLVAWQRFFWR